MKQLQATGLMIVLSSPSGAGKTTLSKAIIANDSNIKLSVSVTTRPMRNGEIDGQDYIFVDQAHYDELVKNDQMLEHAEVFGYSYGTPRKQTEEKLRAGFDILYDIDWQGALTLISKIPQDIVSIFILPPSMPVLEQRLRNRAADSESTIQRRLSEASIEISKCSFYDYIIINHDIEESISLIQNIISAERLKRTRLLGLQSFVDSLNTDIVEITQSDMELMKNAYVIDVRELHEWRMGHIPGALHIPLTKLFSEDFSLDKTKPCIIYCQHGVRSVTGAKFLKSKGFVEVASLRGGIAMWQGDLAY